MNDSTKSRVEEIIMLHAKGIKEIGVTADKATTLVENLAKLYRLRQKDDELEESHDEFKEKLAYDNGRADEELRIKEAGVKNDADKLELESKKLDFDREKFQCELALKEADQEIEKAKLKQGKVGQVIQAATAATGTLFNAWLSQKVMLFEKEGVVGSFIGKKVFGSMLGKQKVE